MLGAPVLAGFIFLIWSISADSDILEFSQLIWTPPAFMAIEREGNKIQQVLSPRPKRSDGLGAEHRDQF